MADRTVVTVVHRMRTVQRADRIAFLDGRVVEDGDHEEPIRRCADFLHVDEVSSR
jgi:ATP-binding cassette, subfamily B, bacterial IrtB/YbtQ